MIKVRYSGIFRVMYRVLLKNNLKIESLILRKISIFSRNPDDTRLDNHPLKRRLAGKWTFSITGDIRIPYEWLGKNQIRFLAIGGHKSVYIRRPKSTHT